MQKLAEVDYDPLLLTPGPTNIHPYVLESMAKTQLAHSSPEFIVIFKELTELLRELLGLSRGELAIVTGSGTLGLEAVFSSLLREDDNVLVLSTGFFGEQLAKLAGYYSRRVDTMRFRLGEAVSPDKLKDVLSKRRYRIVCVTHVDTSTGVLNPIHEIVGVASSSGALTLVDAVSSIGGVEFDFDKLGADIVVTSSQKCLAAPPGVAIIAVSDNVYRELVNKRVKARSYYLDLLGWINATKKPGEYRATPSVHVYVALKRAVELVLEEGVNSRWARHEEQARYLRHQMFRLGFDIVALNPSPTVSVFDTREVGRPPGEIKHLLYEKHRICVSTGMPPYVNRFLRVGHMGNITKKHLGKFIDALKTIME